MENSFIIEEWVLEDVIDTLRQMKNYRDEVSTTETALDRSIANSKKLLENIKNTKPIFYSKFHKY
jgi:hypothetical protein|uniref:Uncharacterized protein n=1 Tax=Myoviridae sp. ctNQV2 TaxID=2827683 RepID=A0A8S5RYQ0_9CAUD|nr:MAG TPA: hypothetical protein [Myoviridae sp. ctNQV2]